MLRLAGLSHAIVYAQGPGGALAITEVHVVGEERGGAPGPWVEGRPASHDRAPDKRAQRAAALVAPHPREGSEEPEREEPERAEHANQGQTSRRN